MQHAHAHSYIHISTGLAGAADASRADVDTEVGATPDVDVVLVGTDGARLAHGQRGGVDVGVVVAVDALACRLGGGGGERLGELGAG
eukprot:scaffold56128_cov59-Phaeocystis_antarctica.AAC.2